MRVTDLFIHRAAATTLLMLAIAGFGIMSYFSLPVSALPEVEYPTIQVSAALPGANPDTMAATVATPLESELSLIPGIKRMTSSSATGTTTITLQFDLSRSVDAAAQDVQAAISRAAGALPTNLPAPPSYSKVNPAQDPILWLEMSSTTMAYDDFARYANTVLAKRLSMVGGVSQVQVYGPDRPAIRVQADPVKLAAYGLDLEQIRNSLLTNSSSLPSGMLYGSARDYSLQSDSQLQTSPQFSQLIVAYRNGQPLRLNQVASVSNSSSNIKRLFWINGRRSVILAVRKQPGSNTIEVADRVKEVMLSLRDSMPPGVSFGNAGDNANIIRDSIADVNKTLIVTIILVILVIFAFLGTLSATIIASATIPVSILGTFIVMKLLGYSIDMFSMMAITLSVGFIVDDAIVMIENIVRHGEMGKDPMQTAVDGAREIGFTILSMTVSLVAVFLPVVFLNGVLGRLLREFAITISISILLSGVTAMTLTPMLCSRFLRQGLPEKHNWLQLRFERGYATVENLYRRSLDVALRHRWAVITTSVLMTAISGYLFFVMPKSFMPNVDVGAIRGSLEASQDNSFDQMTKYGKQVNQKLESVPGMQSFVSAVESQNFGWFYLSLNHDTKRPSTAQLMSELQRQFDAIPGLKVYLRQPDFVSFGQDEGRSQYSASLEGPDAQQLYEWAPRLKTALESISALKNVSSNLQLNAPRINVEIQRDRAMALNVDPEKVANTLYDAYGNRIASNITVASERYDVILEVAQSYRQDPQALGSLYILSNTGRPVPLSAIATLKQGVAPLTANHVGQFPAVTFQFDLSPGVSLESATQVIREAAKRLGMPATLSFSFQGTAAQFQNSFKGLGVLLLIAVVVIYIVLGILYESFIHPITILSGLPSTGIGALLTLLLFGEDLNLYSFLGIILLIGIVKKNAIMIVDFALNAERDHGLCPTDAVYRGCLERFRPIMMTTLAALLGALPIALGSGVGGEARRPLGLSIVGGLLVSQSLTLYLTPVLYLTLHRFQKARQRSNDSDQKHVAVQPA